MLYSIEVLIQDMKSLKLKLKFPPWQNPGLSWYAKPGKSMQKPVS